MEVRSVHKYARVSAQKCRLVADQVRGMKIGAALDMLKFSNKKSAFLVGKVLRSAIANAEHNHGADIDELTITQAMVDEGPAHRRYRARARGRPGNISKRTSHITIAVGDGRD